MNNYYVYMHIFPNKKVYIGITSQKPKRRWCNGKGYKNNQYMTNAILKYGWDNIEHIILYKNKNKKEAEEIERRLIKEYKSNKKQYGYNILDGGNLSNGLTEESLNKMRIASKNNWKNNEYRKYMSEVHKGRKATLGTRQKMSKSNNKFWLGKKLSDETKEKISNSLKGRTAWNKNTKGIMKPNKTSFKKGEIHSITKRVLCIENNIIYDTINQASRELNINATCIINVCKGKQKKAGNKHFKYYI